MTTELGIKNNAVLAGTVKINYLIDFSPYVSTQKNVTESLLERDYNYFSRSSLKKKIQPLKRFLR